MSPPLTGWGLARLVETGAPRLALVGQSADVVSCLRSLQQAQPDVVVIDVDLSDATDAIGTLHQHTRARVLALSGSRDEALLDAAILAGARGVIGKHEPPEGLCKAIEKVHAGEIWLDRHATGRVFLALARKSAAREPHPEQIRIDSLTRRERQTVVALAREPAASGKQVAEKLHISEHTLRNHLTAIYSKLGVNNRVDLYAFVQRHGLAA